MAVNVSTPSSVCLYCKTTSDAEKEFHEIYDEVGLELQLPTLLETFFHIKVVNDGKNVLCDDCLNRLIDLYDMAEHAKEKKTKAADVETTKRNVANDLKSDGIDDSARQTAIKKASIIKGHSGMSTKDDGCQLKEEDHSHSMPNNSKIGLQNSNTFEYKSLNLFPLTSKVDLKNVNQQSEERNIDNLVYESMEDEINNYKEKHFDLPQIQAENNISEEEEFVLVHESDESQDINESTSNIIIEVRNPDEDECNEHIEYIEDFEVQGMEIEDILSTNSINASEELEATRQNRTETSVSDGQNDLKEDNTLGADLTENIMDNSKPVYQQEDDMEDIYMEESENIFYEEDSQMHEETDCVNETLTTAEKRNNELNSSEIEIKNNVETATVSSNCNENDAKFYNVENVNTGEIITVDQLEDSDDDFCLEEEYLIEEITCSEDYDNVDLHDYLDKVLVTKFHDLQLKWETECKLCLHTHNTFEELLNHPCMVEFEEDERFCCTIKDCDENTNNLNAFARHLVLTHYDKLESVSIYGKCPDCQKTFSNILDFNKHSCCRNIKRKSGSPNYCQYCDMDFQSLKRYVFHMQFHLTNRRPKVCLLCGDLFKNSNDFFEHTQYQHIPDNSMACIKCDRFFKKKEVFQNHMELHEDSKYQYCCTLCPKKYTNKFGLNQHVDTYHNNKSNALRCSYCEKEFVNKLSYRNHMKCHGTDVQVESFICSTCGIITNNSEFIKHHVESDEDSVCFSSSIEEATLGFGYTCENCSLDFHTIKHLKAHRLSNIHSDELFYCGICRQSFKSLLHMRNHSSNHKDFKEWQEAFPITRFFVCNIGDCQEFYPIWTTLYYHKRRPHKTAETSTSPSKFECQFCQQLCTSKMSLAVHVARSHNNSNIKCPYCKRGLKSKQLLQQHVDHYHTKVECDICFKKFKNRRNLESHNNMVHLNIKRYFCKHCEKGYFHKSEKDLHEKKVHPKVAFKCEICNFTTNYPESLEIHMDKHNNQLKFQCTICGKEFGRKQLLKSHLKRHVDKKAYQCANYLKEKGCDATFISCALLKRHIQNTHPNSGYIFNIETDDQSSIKTPKKFSETDLIDISYEILEIDDNNSMTEKRNSNDAEFEGNAIEFVLENDVEFDEQ